MTLGRAFARSELPAGWQRSELPVCAPMLLSKHCCMFNCLVKVVFLLSCFFHIRLSFFPYSLLRSSPQVGVLAYRHQNSSTPRVSRHGHPLIIENGHVQFSSVSYA